MFDGRRNIRGRRIRKTWIFRKYFLIKEKIGPKGKDVRQKRSSIKKEKKRIS
jgi:hypothetical protein